MSAEEGEEEGIQQPFEMPLSITNDYFRAPALGFPGAPSFPGAEVYFHPNNIFRFTGHGKEKPYLNLGGNNDISHRYKLRTNQYALIPGKCGNTLFDQKYYAFKDFYKSTKPIKLFNSSTKNSNVGFSSKVFTSIPENKDEATVSFKNQLKEGQLKFYYPKTKNSNSVARTSLPPLILNPISFYINKARTELQIYNSGILRKSQPYKMDKSLIAINPYEKSVPITEAALQLKFGYFTNPPGDMFNHIPIEFTEKDVIFAKDALSLIENSLGGSVLTFKNLVAMVIIYIFGNYSEGYAPISYNNMFELTRISMDEIMARTQMDQPEKTRGALLAYNSLSIHDILHFNIPIEFIYKFLDSKTNNQPYLVLFSTCRGLKLDNSHLDEGTTQANVIARRRALSNVTALASTEAVGGGGAEVQSIAREAAGGGGGGVEQTNSEGIAGGTRRRRRFPKKKRRTRRR